MLTGPKVKAHFGMRWWPKQASKVNAKFYVTSDTVPFKCDPPEEDLGDEEGSE